MHQYRAKAAYQDADAAQAYDSSRFSSLIGRLRDVLEKRAILATLSLIPPPANILDLPCGTGRITEWLLGLGYYAHGADISAQMLGQARKRLAAYHRFTGLTKCDAEALPFADGAFDALTVVRLMGHVPPPCRVQMLKEMKRVCAGPLLVMYYRWNPLTEARRWLLQRFERATAPWYPTTVEALAEEATHAGLSIASAHQVAPFLSEAWVLAFR